MKQIQRLLLTSLILLLVACQQDVPPLVARPTATAAPPTATAEPTATPLPDPATVAGFDYFLEELQAARPADRQPLINRYLAAIEAPITGETQAIFLWQGEAQQVQVVGDMTNWDPAGAPELSRIEGTSLWYLPAEYPANARFDYKFVIDGANWQLDPLNPRTILGGFGANSELVMPGYEMPPELEPTAEEIPAGTLTQHTLDSAHLGQTRTFYVYTPNAQLIGAAYPSVYIHDGGDYLDLIDTPALLDRLIAARTIPPLVAVFIPPIQRELEYNRNDAYVAFLADELAPFVRANYRTDPDPARTSTAGASMGGLIAVYAALTRPATFGLALGQSGAYSVDGDAVISDVIIQESAPVRFYLVVGTYETAVGGDSNRGNLLAANQRLVRALQNRFYELRYEELPEGHSWGLWRGTLGRGLQFLYSDN
jgi:enterochelin esterase family protein